MGRPPTRPSKLKDGFYIEVRSKGSKSGIKVRAESKEKMNESAMRYGKTKDVTIMGEYKNGKPLDKQKKKVKAKAK